MQNKQQQQLDLQSIQSFIWKIQQHNKLIRRKQLQIKQLQLEIQQLWTQQPKKGDGNALEKLEKLYGKITIGFLVSIIKLIRENHPEIPVIKRKEIRIYY